MFVRCEQKEYLVHFHHIFFKSAAKKRFQIFKTVSVIKKNSRALEKLKPFWKKTFLASKRNEPVTNYTRYLKSVK